MQVKSLARRFDRLRQSWLGCCAWHIQRCDRRDEPSTALSPAESRTTLSLSRNSDLKRNLILSILLLGSCLGVTSSALAADQVMLSATPSTQEIVDAKAALQKGDIIAMQDVHAQTFSATFNAGVAVSHRGDASSKSYCVIAAVYDQRNVLHTYRGPSSTGTNADSKCLDRFKTWAGKLTSLRPNASSGLHSIPDDTPGNGPPAAAWTPLMTNTEAATDPNNNEIQITYSIYRANSNVDGSDYYSVVQQAEDQPNFIKCDYIGYPCGWFADSRSMKITATDLNGNPYPVYDHGPLATNGSVTTSFSVGASVNDKGGVSLSAGYGYSYSQSDVTTTDGTPISRQYAAWSDKFLQHSDWPHSALVPAQPPAALKGLWESYQSAIFTVPISATAFNISIDDAATFCYLPFQNCNYSTAELADTITVFPPTISVSPATLRLTPGQAATLTIDPEIQGVGTSQLSWTVNNTDAQNNINLSSTTGAGYQQVTVSVPPGTALGTQYLTVDTSPSYATAQTKTGPISVPVEVMSPSSIMPGVLVTGGVDWTGHPLYTAEVWSPASNQSTAVAQMQEARYLHTATPIVGNRVLIVGGLNDSFNLIQMTELYDEASQTFVGGASLQVARALHTATLLNDGTVLIAGGESDSSTGAATASAELYDPVANTTSSVGNMTAARLNHTATMLSSGDVLICGGSDSLADPLVSSCELYIPESKSFVSVDSSSLAGLAPVAAASLTNGQVLLTGSNASDPADTVGLYTPSSNSYSSFPNNAAYGGPGTALVGVQGSVAVGLGGSVAPQSTWVWSPTYQQVLMGGQMLEMRNTPDAVYLQNTNTSLDGYIVALGGVVPNTGSSNGTAIEVENPNNPALATWSQAGNLTTPRGNAAATLIIAPVTPILGLASSANPSILGTNVTFTATIASSGQNATGLVAFTIDSSTTPVASVSVQNGTASYSTNSLPVGTHTVTASYNGGAGLLGNSSSVTQVVNSNPVAATFSNLLMPLAVNYGTPTIHLSGSVSGGTAANPIYPQSGEQVSVTIGASTHSTGLGADGTFSFDFPLSSVNGPLDAGNYLINYSYGGGTLLKSVVLQYGSLQINSLTTHLIPTQLQPVSDGTQNVLVGGSITAGTIPVTGSVMIKLSQGTTSISSITAPIQSSGQFSGSLSTAALPPGQYTVSFEYAATVDFSEANLSIPLSLNASPTATTLTATPAPGSWLVGQPVTLTAAVAGSNGVPSGTVTFLYGTTVLGTAPLNNGVATYTASSPVAAPYSLTASYAGQAPFQASTSPVVQGTISKNNTLFSSLTATQLPTQGAPSVAVTGKVWAPNGPTGIAATATQASSNDAVGVFFSNLNASGVTTDAATFSAWVKTSTTTAQMLFQEPDANPAIWIQNNQIGVFWMNAGAPASGWLSSDTTPISDGQWHHIAVTFHKGAITLYKDGVATSDTFSVGTSATSDPAINIGGGYWNTIPSFTGQIWNAQVWASASAPADIQAQVFPNYNGSYPAALRLLSSFSSAAINLINGSSARVNGVALTSATLPFPGQYPSSDESVQVSLETASGKVLGTQKVPFGTNGTFAASATLSGVSAGNYIVTFHYAGNAALSPSPDGSTKLVIQALGTSFANLVVSPAAIQVGNIITASGSIAAGSSIPTGSVSITVSNTAQQVSASAPIKSSGKFSTTLDTSSLAPGVYTVTYTFAASGGFSGASNSSSRLTVNKAQSTTSVTSTPNPSTPGQQVTITAKLTGLGGTPTGTVTFTDGNTALGTVPLKNGVALYQSNNLSAGPHVITAAYSGDTTFATSSNTTTQMVNRQLQTELSMTASPNPADLGQVIILTAKVVPAGVTPTGNISFSETIGQNSYYYGNANLDSNGLASVTINPSSLQYMQQHLESAGSHTLYATYSGDSSYPAATSTPYTMTLTSTGIGIGAPPPISQFNFKKGFASAGTQMALNGTSKVIGSRLQLTDSKQNETGSAFFATPVNIQAFTSDFVFQITDPEADGFTFTMQNAKTGSTTLGDDGGALGYGGIKKSVAIKFDLHDNSGEGSDSTGLYIDGEQPALPSIDLMDENIDLHSGHRMNAHVIYDGTNLTLTLTDAVTYTSWSHAFPINISATVGGAEAYIGFTGGTGALTANQELLSWTYTKRQPHVPTD